MKPSQPMQVISHRLTSPRAPSTPLQSEHAPDKVDGKTPGSLSSREESAGTPTALEERRKAKRECGKDYEATGFTHSVPYIYIYTVYHIHIYGTLCVNPVCSLKQRGSAVKTVKPQYSHTVYCVLMSTLIYIYI
jgi:hypothetical protein